MSSGNAADANREALDGAIDEFTSAELGPGSVRELKKTSVREAVHRRLEDGASLEDAVLAEIHGRVAGNRRVANEFAAYFLFDLMKMGKLSMSSSSRLRRFLDTGDLVLSVFGDLWGDLATLKFESRQQFTNLFHRRMSWKAADEARRMQSQRRREDRRVPQQPEDLDLFASDPDAGPLPDTIRKEEHQRFILILLRLKDRERKILTMHLRGASIESIAQAMDLSYDAARKALSRAVEHARQLADASERRRQQPRVS